MYWAGHPSFSLCVTAVLCFKWCGWDLAVLWGMITNEYLPGGYCNVGDFSGLLSSCSWIAFCVLQLNAYPHGQVFVRHAHLCLAHLPWPGDRPMLAASTRLYHMHWAPDDGVVTIVKANCEMVLSRLLCHNQRLEHNNRNYIGETSAEQHRVYIYWTEIA